MCNIPTAPGVFIGGLPPFIIDQNGSGVTTVRYGSGPHADPLSFWALENPWPGTCGHAPSHEDRTLWSVGPSASPP